MALVSSLDAAPNQPPTACFTVTPAAGTIAASFAVDATCSTDDHTAPAKLKVRWDWENDGVNDTASTTTKTASHSFGNEGVKTIKLEVRDTAGLVGTTTRTVRVVPTLTQSLVSEPAPPGAGEPDVDFSPGDPQRLVVSANTADSNVGTSLYPAFVSSDGGASWSRATGLDGTHTLDSGIEFDGSGRVFLSVIDGFTEDGTSQGVLVSRSTDGGLTYATRSFAMDAGTLFRFPDGSDHSPCVQGTNLLFDYPKMAADRGITSPYRNQLYVIARGVPFDLNGDGICERAETVFIRSLDAGETWVSGQVLPVLGPLTSGIGVGPDGVVYLTHSAFSAPFCPGGIGVAFRKSVDGGASFLPTTCAFPSDGSIQPDRAWTFADPSVPGVVYAAFNAAVTGLSNSLHIYVMRSTDGGDNWTAPVRVDDVLPDDVVDHYRPSISVSTTGRVDVIWFDYRNSTSKKLIQSGQTGDVYYSYSVNGGTTWSSNLRLSTSTSPLLASRFNDFLTVISSGSRAHAAYSQDTDGDGVYEALLTTLTFH